MPPTFPVLRLINLVLALQASTTRPAEKLLSPFLLGKSHNGTRYYFQLWPKGMSLCGWDIDLRQVDGVNCNYMIPHLQPSKDEKEYSVWLSTMDDKEGSKEFEFSGKTRAKACFKTFYAIAPDEERAKRLPSKHSVVSTANRLCLDNELLLSRAVEYPTPNGIYYGFNDKGLEATMKFDGESLIKNVEIGGPQRWRYDGLIFNMIGKAISCELLTNGQSTMTFLILEPVDPTKFDGTKSSFPRARLNTMVGQPFDSNNIQQLFGLPESSKLGAFGSRIAKSFGSIRRPGAAFRRRTGGMLESTEDEIDAAESTLGYHNMITK